MSSFSRKARIYCIIDNLILPCGVIKHKGVKVYRVSVNGDKFSFARKESDLCV